MIKKPHALWFPYYIVRFKQTKRPGIFKEENKFPYYIVRFKPYTDEPPLLYINLFPYYIVRFKPSVMMFFRKKNSRFHTT